MTENRFQIGEAIKFGWNTMTDNIWFFIALYITAFLICITPGIIAEYAGSEFPIIYFALTFAGWLLGYVVEMGLVKVALKFCDGIRGKLDDLLSSFDILLPFLAVSILYSLIIFCGLLLFIVPGVIWGIKFSLYPYFIVEKRLGPIEALKASSRATSGAKWNLLLLWVLLALINLAGFLAFIVGLFVTVPISMVAYAYVYRRLTGALEEPGLVYEV